MASGAPMTKRRTDLPGSNCSALAMTWRARSRISATGPASCLARSLGTTPLGWRRNSGSCINLLNLLSPWLTADGETCMRAAARPTWRSSSTASNRTRRLRSMWARLVFFSIWLKSYHWIQHVFPAYLSPEEIMNAKALFLVMTVVASTAFGKPEVVLEPDRAALEVVSFWREAGPALWFAKDAQFDARFRERFLREHEAAARGELMLWQR